MSTYLLSKQKTRLGPRGADWHVILKPGIRVPVPDDDVDRLLAWGKGGGRRLQRAGLLRVIRGDEAEATDAAKGRDDDDAPTDPFADGIPDTLEDLTVRKARPFIDAAEDLETVHRWAEAEAAGLNRASIMDPLKRRYVELGGELPDDDDGKGDAGDGDGGSEG